MRRTYGLKFKKFDLHVHTPASHCYGEKENTPEDIINEAISKELFAIAITDHNTGDFIDKVKESTKGKKYCCFPRS